MHAPSDRGPEIGKRGAVALLGLVALVSAACSTGGSDNPALPSPNPTNGAKAKIPPGPPVHVVSVAGKPVPQLPAGFATINAGLQSTAAQLGNGCRVNTTRDDPKLVSFRWVCGSKVTTTSFSVAEDRPLALSDLLQGGYATYLSATAANQLQVEGKSTAGTTDLAHWALTPEALEVTFPGGTVAFPLTSLTHYLKDPPLLTP